MAVSTKQLLFASLSIFSLSASISTPSLASPNYPIFVSKQDAAAKEVYKTSLPSVVAIVALDENNQPLNQGTGFFIKTDLVVTTLHTLRTAKKIKIIHSVSRKDLKIKGVHAIGLENDLVAFRMAEAGAALPASNSPTEIGETVIALGGSHDAQVALHIGSISGQRKLEKTEMSQMTASVSPGASGGPVLNTKGQLVGIATNYVEDGRNINGMIALKPLREVLNSNTTNSVLSLATLAALKPTLVEKRKVALDTIRITAPEVHWGHNPERTQFGIDWDLSVKNDGDKAVKDISLLILIFDKQSKDMIHYIRKKLPVTIPSKLAKRTRVAEGPLDFSTSEAEQRWTFEFRILDFEYDDSD